MDQPESRAAHDLATIRAAHGRGMVATLIAYAKLSGPGWLQSAITLGGGSLASSLYLGVLGGTTLLWLQPLAIIFGAVMLAAIAQVALVTQRRPFELVTRELNPVLGYGWALASLLASMVWAMPQFALATGVVQQNLLPSVFGGDGVLGATFGRVAVVAILLLVTIFVTWSYGKGTRGIAVYERTLKLVVAAIVICFVGVTVRLALTPDGLHLGALLRGFVPDPASLSRPSPEIAALMTGMAEDARRYWTDLVVGMQREVVISAAATAVGINMTFLMPCTLLQRGWTREFAGLARTDLALGMLVPFVLATSCIVVAAASRFHATPVPGLVATSTADTTRADAKALGEFTRLCDDRLRISLGAATFDALGDAERAGRREALPVEERIVAATLVKRDAFDLAKALQPLTGELFADLLFGLGVLGMAMSTATLLMLICGFVIAEMTGLPANSRKVRLWSLLGATGALGPFLWSGASPWLAVPTSMFGMTLLPIAYWTFLLLMNNRRVLGDAMPRGRERMVWNLLMLTATLLATFASAWSIWTQGGKVATGIAVCFVAAAIATGRVRRR
ncbi:MAG: divalent metal cation transporter [Planctomycetota bacterium]